MGVKEQMLGVLRSREAQRISFNFSGTTGVGIAVNGGSFGRVAQAIENNSISVVEGGVANGWARYDSRRNTFNIGRGQEWSRAFNALLIHEAVHAAFDLSRSTLPWLDNEAAAYIAQGFYLRNSGFSRNRLTRTGDTNQPYLGLMIVDSVVRDGRIDGFWLEQLHGSLLSNRSYHSYIRETFTGDG